MLRQTQKITSSILTLTLILFFFSFPNEGAVTVKNFKVSETETSSAKRDKAPNFTLEDQFGNKMSVNFPSDKVAVLIFGDRKGSEQVEGWVRPLYNKYTNQIYIFGIAELSVVPWAVRPVVRTMIKSKSKTPVMLDWTGKISKSYGYEKGKANVFIISRDGSIVDIKKGAVNNGNLNSVYQSINSIL